MKVGILTFHFAPNSGAVIQAWGLQQAIESLGHETCIINYIPEYMRPRISPFRGWGLCSGRRFLKVFSHRLAEARRRGEFQQFTQEHLKLTPILRTKRALRDYCQNLDAIVVGSDQVWNMAWHRDFDDTYFLGFLDGSTGPRKIAYGACFGQISQPAPHLSKAIELIRRFDAIGMRNEFGLRILAESGGISASKVVDPAFFIPPVKAGPCNGEISIYAVATQGGLVCTKVARQVARILNAPVRHIRSENHIEVPSDFGYMQSSSPIKWMNQLANSRFICTESFHGAVIAIANNVPFISASGVHRSARVEDLLTQYGLKERFLANESQFDSGMCDMDNNYGLKLQDDIQASIRYLKEVL